MSNNTFQKAGYAIGIGLGIILLSAFLYSQVLFPLLFGKPRNVVVPELVGMSITKARRTLTELGLHTVIRDSVWSETSKIEAVLEQYPPAGEKLKPEGTVHLVISRGSKIITIPSVAGRNYTEAYLTLRNAGLRVAVIDSLYSNSYPINTVVRSSPAAGSQAERSSTVKLILSKGPEPPPDTLRVVPEYFLD